ncbi:hypothetical protein KAFR_0G03310 [Kazachstania africana CBS 2517]|uniref:E3 ubiquitin protein ligase n=1 Tax=Kazachstania africana (strain ATCC 22294 / BCRC 22015 / CBS 2517 / CECT 1963 / NBRC 1671 / NRRL Y-8276) TaxID=1071382 RepID=H2AYB3_KAZAF|nr:hypothetical protein KAFR_0G03310 [Kazachstania africana CBS 2517]CCF59363.1 hypothetical protein KAFR_0G03310 [Kazachstania africana CBS 2517]
MSVEPPTKKLKLNLSDPNEPLTQRDVISFQKEALFRLLNDKRNNLNVINEQYEITNKKFLEISSKFSNLLSLVLTLAKSLEIVVKDNDDDMKIIDEVLNSDEDKVVELTDKLLSIFTKYSSNSGNVNAENNSFNNFSSNLKSLQKDKLHLLKQNEKLIDELNSIKSYYQNLVKKYDREDSQTIKRVFKKDLETEQDAKEETTSDTQEPVKTEEQIDTVEKSNGVNEVEEDSSQNDDVIMGYELKTKDLQDQINNLKLMVDEMEKFKKMNEEKIISLETQLSNENLNNHNSNEKDPVLLEKLSLVTKENHELKEVNDSFLIKFQTLSSEREIFNNRLTEEFNKNFENLKKQNYVLEKDLVRIRTARDELLSKIAVLESETKQSIILEDLKRLIDISNEQLEKIQSRSQTSVEPNQDALLREIYEMEKGIKELTQLNNKKYAELINYESVISKLTIEKTKADQKYFAAMRSKDSILIENKNYAKTLAKSNELILNLKDNEKLLLSKIENLQKQLALSQNNEKRLIDSNKSESLKLIELNSQINKINKTRTTLSSENLKLVNDLNKLKTLNNDLSITIKSNESRLKSLTEKCDHLQDVLLSKKKANNLPLNDDDHQELENFRQLVYCSLCSKNWKNMAIKTCGHIFCEDCCKERLAARMRKCPTCNNPFSSNDLFSIHL